MSLLERSFPSSCGNTIKRKKVAWWNKRDRQCKKKRKPRKKSN